MGIGTFDDQEAKVPYAAVSSLNLPPELVAEENDTMRRHTLMSTLMHAHNKKRALKATSDEWKKHADYSSVAIRKASTIYANTVKDQFMEREKFHRAIEDFKSREGNIPSLSVFNNSSFIPAPKGTKVVAPAKAKGASKAADALLDLLPKSRTSTGGVSRR